MLTETYTCKACGKVQPFSHSGCCKTCFTGLLAGFSHADGPCMVRGCTAERTHGRYLSDGNRYVYECTKHAGRGRSFNWQLDRH